MLKRAGLKEYYYNLWKIWGDYQNKEVFWLDLEVKSIWRFLPFVKFKLFDSFSFYNLFSKKDNLEDISWNSYYFELIFRFLVDFIEAIVFSQKDLWKLPDDFSFDIIRWENWNFKLVSKYLDELVVKRFIIDLHTVFSDVVDQKYVLKYPFAYFNWDKVVGKYVDFGLPDTLCRNKSFRNSLKSVIKRRNLKVSFLLSWWLFLYLPNIFFKALRFTNQYKKISKLGVVSFVYLKGKDNFERQEYVGKSPFVESRVEKLWL